MVNELHVPIKPTLKCKHDIYLTIIYYLLRKNPNSLALKFDYFSIFLYGAIFFKEINIV